MNLNDSLAFVYQNGGRIFDDLMAPTRTTFNDPLTIEALQWYSDLMYKRDAAATPRQARESYGIGGSIQNGIEQGRLGMWTGGLAERGGRLNDEGWSFEWGVVPLPRGAQAATFASVGGLAIREEAQNPDVCWEWIAFLTRQVPLDGIPAREPVAESETYADLVGRDVAAAARASMENPLYFSPALYDVFDAFRVYERAAVTIIEGNTPAAEALNKAQQESKFRWLLL